MGLLDFFKSFGSKAERDKAQQDLGNALTSLDIDVAIGAHQNWKDRLALYLDGNSTEDLRPEVICHDDRCDLGKWVHNNGKKFYGDEVVFQRLVGDHAAFHRAAGDVVGLYKNKGERDARRVLTSDFDLYSLRVIDGLEQLERRVKQ